MSHFRRTMQRGRGGQRPVLLHFHGAGGSGAASAGNRDIFGPFLDAGWAAIAPDRRPRAGSDWLGWNLYIPNGGRDRDEVAFVREIGDDAAGGFGIDPGFAVASGFSLGGSAVWNLACHGPDLFYAHAPVAGGFWRPHLETCEGPVRTLAHAWLGRWDHPARGPPGP